MLIINDIELLKISSICPAHISLVFRYLPAHIDIRKLKISNLYFAKVS